MRKTRTFLEKLAPKSVNREDDWSNWSTILMGLQNPQTDHIIISSGDENEQKLIKQMKREDERKSSGMKQGERSWPERRWCAQ